MAVAPSAVRYGTMDPQAPGTVEPQVTLHVTPPGAASLVTSALTWAVAVVATDEGGCCTNAIVGAGVVMVVSPTASLPGVEADEAAEVAVIMTRPLSLGIVLGAV